MSYVGVPPEQIPILLAPDPALGPWAVVPKFVVLEDDSIRCSGLTVEWCPMMLAREAGNGFAVRDQDGAIVDDGSTVPWSVASPGTMPPPEELTATVIRSIAVTTLVSQARKALPSLEALASGFDSLAANMTGDAPPPTRRFVKDPSRRRRRRLDDDHFDEIARVYLEAPKYRRRAVAEHFQVAPATASDYIEECRRRGLLPPAGRRSTG